MHVAAGAGNETHGARRLNLTQEVTSAVDKDFVSPVKRYTGGTA